MSGNGHRDKGNMEYNEYIDQKIKATSVSSPTRTRDEVVEDYRLEQRFPDEINTENTEDKGTWDQGKTSEKKLGHIIEETVESVSSEEGRHKIHYLDKKLHIRNFKRVWA